MRRLTLLILIALSSFPTAIRAADYKGYVLNFLLSDIHNNYARMITSIRAMSVIAQAVEQDYPGIRIVLSLNGDTGGLSNFTDFLLEEDGIESDYGSTMLESLALLGHYYWIAKTLGNHEQFDWAREPGNLGHTLFLDQQREFMYDLWEIGKQRDFHILGANVVPGETALGLFGSYMDVPLNNGDKVRYIGLVLNNFFRRSNYVRDSPIEVIRDIRPMSKVAIEQLLKAEADNVTRLVFQVHDRNEEAIDVHEGMLEFSSSSEEPRLGVKYPVWFAGHDHEYEVQVSNGATFLQCGSEGDFCTVLLDDKHNVVKHKRFGRAQQQKLLETPVRLRPYEQLAVSLLEKRLSQLKEAFDVQEQVLGHTTVRFPNKAELKKQPLDFGTETANILAGYGDTRDKTRRFVANVAMINSSSIRWDDPPIGDVRRRDMRRIYPFLGRVGVFYRTGAQIQKMFRALREYRQLTENYYTPQLCSQLKEAVGPGHRLMILIDGQWVPIESVSGQIRLTLDPWLSEDGYELRGEWEGIRQEYLAQLKASPRQHPRLKTLLIESGRALIERVTCADRVLHDQLYNLSDIID